MGVPSFLLRKLYRRGSLRETGDGRFAFALQNPLATTTLLAPPHFVINGVSYEAADVDAGELSLDDISDENPLRFKKGSKLELRFPGRLLRGGNRIHVSVVTKEFGDVEFLVEDKEADFCDVPGTREEE